jgi:pimeloyl-ACP methyl ester carboxylesterase
MKSLYWCFTSLFFLVCCPVSAQIIQNVINLPTRDGVTNRAFSLTPPNPKATFILMVGGHGGLQMYPGGSVKWGEGNFLARSKQLFADQGAAVLLVDSPSDRQSAPYLVGFRQTSKHALDLGKIISWARENNKAPVWVVGTSNGTLSAAYIATQLEGADAPDGVVLTSSVLWLAKGSGRPVPDMPLEKIRIPVLVVHHEKDACDSCLFSQINNLTTKLINSPKVELITFKGGVATGDPCDAFHYHGFNGIESEVVTKIVAWTTSK